MKNGIGLILLGIVIGVGCTKALDQSATAETVSAPELVLNPGSVFSIFQVELKEGVSEEEYLEFMTKENNPAWNQSMPDMKWIMLRSDRGEMENTYALMAYYPEASVRGKYWPSQTERTEKFKEINERHADLRERANLLGGLGRNRDYVVIE